MTQGTALISGAGVAGSTLAYWLARNGFRPTVVERSRGMRSSGNPVDVRGPALPVAEAMGIMPSLRDAATHATALRFVNASGRQVARVPTSASRSPADSREVEIPRADLAAILYEVARDDAEFLFDDAIATLEQDEHGVEATFGHAAPRRFDLVLGADGVHSAVRRLTFGPERDFVRHMGIYVATMPLDGPVDDPYDVVLYNASGRLVSIHPSRGKALTAFIFRAPAIADLDYRDTRRHKGIVTQAYAGAGWRLPELLERLQSTEDLYFDSVSQVRMSAWSLGRVAVLGDAASCLSLFGDGSSLAIAGAATLAGALAEARDPATAFRRYESAHRARTEPKQRSLGRAAALLVPKTRGGILVRNLAAGAWGQLTQASTTAHRTRLRRQPIAHGEVQK